MSRPRDGRRHHFWWRSGLRRLRIVEPNRNSGRDKAWPSIVRSHPHILFFPHFSLSVMCRLVCFMFCILCVVICVYLWFPAVVVFLCGPYPLYIKRLHDPSRAGRAAVSETSVGRVLRRSCGIYLRDLRVVRGAQEPVVHLRDGVLIPLQLGHLAPALGVDEFLPQPVALLAVLVDQHV